MVIGRRLIGAAILFGAAVVIAGPASADPFVGLYRFESSSNGAGHWTVTPCEPYLGCNALIGVIDTSDERLGQFVGRATLDGDRWNMTVDRPDSIRCELNGRTYPGRFEFSWGGSPMSGTIVSFQTAPSCGRPAMTVADSGTFRLTENVT